MAGVILVYAVTPFQDSMRSPVYSITALTLLENEFNGQVRSEFDAFKLVRGNTLKWYEAERAVVRALVEGSAQGNSFGRQWPFFAGTFLANLKAKLQLQPQVIPRVYSNGSPLNEGTLEAWEKGNREAPPQGTMDHNGWARLMPYLDINRPIIPVEISRSPDIMFVLQQGATANILCFLVKTGVQDLSLPYIQAEVAKSPFLRIRPSGEV